MTESRERAAVGTLERDLQDAMNPRMVGLVLGVLVLELAFILSYVGAFHHPTPRHVRVAVVGTQQVAGPTAAKLNAIHGQPLKVSTLADEAAARRQIADQRIYAAFVVDPSGSTDRLLVSSAAGSSVSASVEQIFSAVELGQHRSVSITDLGPFQPGDYRGLSGFYAVIGWMVGGYLAASALGMARGSRPSTTQRASIRLAAMLPYSILGGLGGAIILDPVLGAITGHFAAVWAIGTFVAFTSAAAALAAQVAVGVGGTGLVVLVFVILGNPSSGGAYQAPLLPPFWRAIGGVLPPGAGVSAIRDAVYFGGRGIGGPLLVLGIWSLAGILIMLLGTLRFQHAAAAPDVPLA